MLFQNSYNEVKPRHIFANFPQQVISEPIPHLVLDLLSIAKLLFKKIVFMSLAQFGGGLKFDFVTV